MEFEGTVVSVLPVVKGTSARGEWMKQEVIFDQPGEFNRKVCVGFWGDKAQEAGTPKWCTVGKAEDYVNVLI